MKKFATRISSLLLIAGLMVTCTVTVFGAYGYSDSKIETVNGVTYSYKSYIDNEKSGKINFQTDVYAMDSDATIPVGAMGVRARLFDSDGVLKKSTDWFYSDWTSGSITLGQLGSYSATSGYYYSQGQIKLYDGKKYDTYTSYATANFAPKKSSKMVSIQKNENGEIYGSEFFLEQIGIQPDLILAESIDGTIGYVRPSDLNNDGVFSPADTITSRGNGYDHFIPVYMSDGRTIIGQYEIQAGECLRK